MEVYKVGGCIRDYLLKKIPKDIDYVVVGSNEEEMVQLGFKKVGADFPVFLCTNTNEEYALARKEKKINKGYNGFISDTKAVSLEDDLLRRDLTINSMAISNKVEINKDFIIDPFGGISDLENRILRPVSSGFKDDPLRILRVARQRAQLSIFGRWTLDSSIFEYAKELREELSSLTRERVHKELEKLF
jgi:tRNA nucleotidyltransferase (CCA-adding enzyme)